VRRLGGHLSGGGGHEKSPPGEELKVRFLPLNQRRGRKVYLQWKVLYQRKGIKAKKVERNRRKAR